MQFTSAKNHWILPTHSNVTSKIVVGFTLVRPPGIYELQKRGRDSLWEVRHHDPLPLVKILSDCDL